VSPTFPLSASPVLPSPPKSTATTVCVSSSALKTTTAACTSAVRFGSALASCCWRVVLRVLGSGVFEARMISAITLLVGDTSSVIVVPAAAPAVLTNVRRVRVARMGCWHSIKPCSCGGICSVKLPAVSAMALAPLCCPSDCATKRQRACAMGDVGVPSSTTP